MRKIVAGNWKMNMNYHEASKLLDQIIVERTRVSEDVELIIAPPAIYLSEFSSAIRDLPQISLAAQNCYFEENGAFTGEISGEMLASLGIAYCLVGHSERRTLMGEGDVEVNKKIKALLSHGVHPIICVGEDLKQRKSNGHFRVVAEQVHAALADLKKSDFENLIWAYEPVWAIGTGETASPQQAQEMHAFIRTELHGIQPEINNPILYGGSCKPENASEIFAEPDVNGGLIGGASLKADDFIAIAKSF